jgi:hypothetical protein
MVVKRGEEGKRRSTDYKDGRGLGAKIPPQSGIFQRADYPFVEFSAKPKTPREKNEVFFSKISQKA